MEFFGSIILVLAVVVAIVFSLLVLVTGKGDAMGGGSSVRTSFKGKASFDDIISKWTLYMGVAFMSLVLLHTIINNRLQEAKTAISLPKPAGVTPPSKPAPDTNTPVEANVPVEPTNTPAAPATSGAENKPADAANVPTTNTPATNEPAKK